MHSRLDSRAIILLTGLCMIFGLQQIAVKFALEGISPILQAGLRSVGATLLLCGWMRWQGEKIFYRDGATAWGILAGLLFAGEFLLLYWALEYTGAARATVFLYTSPFIVAIGAQLFIPGESLRKLHVAGLSLAFFGILLAFGDNMGTAASGHLTGDMMALGAALLWGATTVVIKASPQRGLTAARVLLYQLGVSALLLPIASLLIGEEGVSKLTPLIIASMAFQTIVVAFIAYLAWFWLIRHYPASRIATFSFMTPLFGVIFAWLILAEQISISFTAALLLVASGIYLVNKP